MIKGIRIFTLFFIFIFCTSSKGQNKPDPSGSLESGAKGVVTSTTPKSISRTIKQDKNGNIWIAAFDGVFKYDGKSFTNITSKVSSARFFSVLVDREGNFWFSTVGDGVYYYDGTSFRHFTTMDGLADNNVIDIYEDNAGNIWFGTDGGASRYNGSSFQSFKMKGGLRNSNDTTAIKFKTWNSRQSLPNVTTREELPDNHVNSIMEDKTGEFWFGTRGNTYIYDGRTFNSFPHGSTFTNVRSIIEDKKGNIWLGGSDGLWRYDGSAFTNFTQNRVGYVYEDKKGNIWASSETAQGWVLSRYEEKSLSHEKPTVTEIKSKYEGNKGMVFGILEANDGSIWFGGLDGVHRYDGNTITDFNMNEGQK